MPSSRKGKQPFHRGGSSLGYFLLIITTFLTLYLFKNHLDIDTPPFPLLDKHNHVNIKATPIHNPTNLEHHPIFGTIINSGGYVVLSNDTLNSIRNNIINNDCKPSSILHRLGFKLAGLICPDQLQDIFDECRRLEELQSNGGLSAEEAIATLQQQYDHEITTKEITKSIHEGIIIRYFNNTISNNIKSVFRQFDFVNSQVEVYMAQDNTPNKTKKKKRRINIGESDNDSDNESDSDYDGDSSVDQLSPGVKQMGINQEMSEESSGNNDSEKMVNLLDEIGSNINLMNDIEGTFGSDNYEEEGEDISGMEPSIEAGKPSTNDEKNLLNIFNQLQYKNKYFIQAAINILKSSGQGSFRNLLRDKLKMALDRYAHAQKNLQEMDVDEIEEDVNDDRDALYNGMIETLPEEHHHRVNVSQRPSKKTKAIVYKHYAPDGTEQYDGHTMPDNQCCIRAVTNGLTRATSYAIEGVTTTEDFSDRVQVIDLACTTAKKKKKVSNMHLQYDKDAELLKLNSRFEYYIVNAINHINSITLSIVVNGGVSVKTLVASRATANDVFGQSSKDRMAVDINESDTIYGIHAQGLMMGQGKSKHYDEVREVMNRNLLSFYAIVLDKTYDDVQVGNEKLLEWYGKEWLDSDIEVGLLSLLAKYFADENELTIAGIKSIKTNVPNDPAEIQDESMRKLYEEQLEVHKTRDKVVDLLLRFRAGHYLQTLAGMLDVEHAGWNCV